ncbi:MAG: hypothetical protein WCI27_05410 [Candidatus Omnitrophota bacterium]
MKKALRTEVIEEVKWYVYVYSDPETHQIFYVGKGNGNRVFQHLDDKSETEKVRKIVEIRSRGAEPVIEFVRYGLTEADSLMVEAAVIDTLGIRKLTNIQRGWDSRSCGRVSVDDVITSYAAPVIKDIVEDVIIVVINKLYRTDFTPQELYEATRSCWRLSARRSKVAYAFSVFSSVLKEVYQVDRWHEVTTVEGKQRWAFEGRVAGESVREKYKGKSVSGFRASKEQNPIKYVNC